MRIGFRVTIDNEKNKKSLDHLINLYRERFNGEPRLSDFTRCVLNGGLHATSRGYSYLFYDDDEFESGVIQGYYECRQITDEPPTYVIENIKDINEFQIDKEVNIF